MSTNDIQIEIKKLRNCEPLNTLSIDQVQVLLGTAFLEHKSAGTILLDSEWSNDFHQYLIKGNLEIQNIEKGHSQLITSDSSEAKHSILSLGKSAQVKTTCSTDVEIINIEKELLETLLTWSEISVPETEVIMNEDGIIAIDKGDWLKSMIQSPTFRKLPPANIEALLNQLEPQRVKMGDTIITQGEKGQYFYMIDEGTALVTRNPDDDEDSIELAELNQGQSFGEAALISENPRNATVSMMTDGLLLRLSKENFNQLLKQPTLKWLSYEDACTQISHGAKWIDVRLPSEYDSHHLPGAISAPIKAIHKISHELDKNTYYICYCEMGNRSSAATFILNQLGFKASVLKHGIQTLESGEMENLIVA